MKSIQCKNCLNLNPADAENCLRCGSSLTEPHAMRDADSLEQRAPDYVHSVPTPTFAAGQVHHLNYTLKRPLGSGGMGEVWLAEQSGLGREVAVKFMHPELMRHPTARQRVLSEAKALGKMAHANIVQIFDYFETKNTVGLVLEYVKDGSLADWIDTKGALSADDAIIMMKGILKGMSALHEANLIHRDMKPDNVLLASVQGEFVPKITDLGVAHKESGTRLTRDGSRLGTPEYMAPEQIVRGETNVSTDIYSCGVMLYEMLTGQLPFSGSDYEIQDGHVKQSPNFSRLPAATPDWLVEALTKALAKDPLSRHSDVMDFYDSLTSPDRASTSAPSSVAPAQARADSDSREYDDSGDPPLPTKVNQGRWLTAGGVIVAVLFAFFVWGDFGSKKGAQTKEKSEESLVPNTNAGGAHKGNRDNRLNQPNDFVRLEPGNFMMGTTFGETGREDDETEHRVRLSQAFYLGKREVTQASFESLLGYNPSKFNRRILGTDTSQHPVESIRWLDAIKYANAYSRQKGLPECYAANGSVKDGSIYKCKGYRLPTEAEWEYAARQGQTRVGNASLYGIAWYQGNSNQQTQPVGTRAANAIGVYDMLGNVWEFCHDWYDDYDLGVAVTADPAGPPSSPKNMRVARGAAWNSKANSNRMGNRHHVYPQKRGRNFGFRLARTAHD